MPNNASGMIRLVYRKCSSKLITARANVTMTDPTRRIRRRKRVPEPSAVFTNAISVNAYTILKPI